MNDAHLPFYIREQDPPAKREILRAAMRLFSTKGYEATSIRDIAKESGYTNPALYKHFSSKEALAMYLFETCHRRMWARCNAAIGEGRALDEKLERYVRQWLTLTEENPEVIAFLSDNARVLWPKASAAVRRQTLIGLARSLALEARRSRSGAGTSNPDLVAASLQGTLGEVARMLEVGVLAGPATRWTGGVVSVFQKLVG